MNNKETRFSKLNNCLGYGNPNGNVIFIGLEERKPWILENLIPGERKDIYERLQSINQKLVEERIEIVKTEFGVDLEREAEIIIDDIGKERIYIPKEIPYEYSKTTHVQSVLSCSLLKLLGVLNSECDCADYERQDFGSGVGNEICLNFYPIARCPSNCTYPEEEYFFGTNAKRKFYSTEYELKRIGTFKLLFEHLKTRMEKEDIFIFLLGSDPYKKLSGIIDEVFEFDFDKNDNDGKLRLANDAMLSNKERNIWSFNHPGARPKDLPLTERDLYEIVIPEIKKSYTTRNE
jgi:hypothetical protein